MWNLSGPGIKPVFLIHSSYPLCHQGIPPLRFLTDSVVTLISLNNLSIVSCWFFFLSCSVHFSCSVMSNSLWPHGLQHAGLPCPSPTPRACSNSCPSSWWRHPTVSSSLIPFSSCLLISYCGRWRVAFSGSSHPWSVCVHTHTNTHKHTPSSCHII